MRMTYKEIVKSYLYPGYTYLHHPTGEKREVYYLTSDRRVQYVDGPGTVNRHGCPEVEFFPITLISEVDECPGCKQKPGGTRKTVYCADCYHARF